MAEEIWHWILKNKNLNKIKNITQTDSYSTNNTCMHKFHLLNTKDSGPRLVMFVKQHRDPCSGLPMDSTNYRKCVFACPFSLIGKSAMPFLTGQSWCVLKSWYTGGDPEKDLTKKNLVPSFGCRLIQCAAEILIDAWLTSIILSSWKNLRCSCSKSCLKMSLSP